VSVNPNADGLIALNCLCRVSGQERRAIYKAVTRELTKFAAPTTIRAFVQADLRVMLDEPDLELLSFEPVQIGDTLLQST
jgi:hypothetical protein